MATEPGSLALLGGAPAFPEPLHLSQPRLLDRAAFLRRVEGMLDRRWYTNDGRLVRELEARLAAILEVPCCALVANGTLALQLLARALDLRGEVLLPSLTFVASAHALRWQGIEPVFCEVDAATHCLDPVGLDARITERTSGILAVHLWGHPCDVDALAALAEARGLRLLFDAAHAFGVARAGRPVGGFGDAEAFSFHATKLFTTLEGGAVTTRDPALDAEIRLLRNFGFAGQDRVISLGTNAKMSEAHAAMGLAMLEELPAHLARHRENHERYRERLAGLPGLHLLEPPSETTPNHQFVVLEVDAEAAGLPRDALLAALRAENVLARRYFHPGCHRSEPYRAAWEARRGELAATERILASLLCLPTGLGVGPEEIETVCGILARALDELDVVRAAWRDADYGVPGRRT